MAFSLQAIVGSTTVSLSDGAPFALRTARGLGGASVRRVTTQGPAQHGDTDKGYRLDPRDIELEIGFRATTDAILDGYRDTLMSVFKPLTNTVVALRLTRDDGEIRQIDCYTIDRIRIDLLPEHRPGHYHLATVRLRAPDPALYRIVPGTATVQGALAFVGDWWLAGGAIGSAQVLMHGGTPGTAEAWSYTGTIEGTTSWTLAVRAEYVTYNNGTPSFMFKSQTFSTDRAGFGRSGTPDLAYRLIDDPGVNAGTTAMTAGTQIYMQNNDPAGLTYPLFGGRFANANLTWLDVTSQNPPYYLPLVSSPGTAKIVGTAMQWRTLGWPGIVPLYALYSPALSPGQRSALFTYMAGFSGSVGQAVAIPYAGDLPEYPIISITGPITGPVITNTATGDALDFGTVSIGAGTTYVIDTRYGYKTVTMGSVDKKSELSADSDLGTWHIAPAPIATGGTNIISVEGEGVGTATTVSVVYYHRFSGY